MKKILVLFTIALSLSLFAQPVIDGNSSEWTGTPPATNSFVYSLMSLIGTANLNEWIWNDANDDHRTDPFGFVDNSKQDIREIRISSDNTNLYYLLTLEPNIDHTPGNGGIQLQISLRRNGSTSTTEYLGGYADNLVPDATTPGGFVLDSRWDYLIITRTGSSNNDHQVWNSAWSLFTAGVLSVNSTNGIIEGSVPWSILGGTPGENTFQCTFSIFRANTSDGTFDTGGDGSKGNCLDYVTTTSGNSYFALIGMNNNAQGRLDYSTNIQFLSNNQIFPVELTSFSATTIGSTVKLSWATATEVNNYGFEILRQAHTSTTLSVTSWEKIGFVQGAGNSNSPKSYFYEDKNVSAGKYSYRLKQIDNDGQFEYSKAIEVDLGAPKKFELSQNYPNPFNPTTTVRFNLPEAGNVKLTLFNILGQELKTLVNEFKESGVHTINFDASELNSGIYIYKLEAGSFVQTRKMTLVK
jgi:hypothetical protein